MRDIKFRAWDGKKMLHNVGFHPFIIQALWRDPDNQMKEGDEGAYLISPQFTQYHLMQFTGLHDKNGKEIYEGDVIVEKRYPYFDNGTPNYVATVEWCFAGFHTVLHCVNKNKRGISDGINEPLEEGEIFEVIGNVFQNPELLGE